MFKIKSSKGEDDRILLKVISLLMSKAAACKGKTGRGRRQGGARGNMHLLHDVDQILQKALE